MSAILGNPGLIVGNPRASGGGGDPWTAWHLPPVNPNANNDEFTSALLDPRWTAVVHNTWTPASYSPVDDAGVPTSATAIKLTPDYHDSWLALQGDGGILRTFTLALPLQIRFRCAVPSNNGVGGAFGNLYCGEYLAGTTPDLTNNYARLGITNLAANQPIILATGRNAGGGGFDVQGPAQFVHMTNVEFILLITGSGVNTFATWLVRDGTCSPTILQGPTTIGSTSNFGSGRPAYIYWRSNLRWEELSTNPGTVSKWNAISTLDYIREYNSTDLNYEVAA